MKRLRRGLGFTIRVSRVSRGCSARNLGLRYQAFGPRS